jgi:Uma2 family endonuclease
MGTFKEKIREVLLQPELSDTELRKRLLEMLAAQDTLHKMTYEEFLAWADEDTLAEWVDGEIIMTSPASFIHQKMSIFLQEVIGNYAKYRQLGQVLVPPFQMKLPKSGREPDLLFVATENLHRIKNTYLDGPADLVVEIISSESAGRDRGDKFYEYEQAAIPEYWLIDPEKRRAEFYALDKEGNYHLAMGGSKGKIESGVLPGFWLEVEWLWADPLPSSLCTLAEIAGIDPSLVEKFEEALRK